MIETGPEAYWREALAGGRFLLQRSRATGEHVFHPRLVAPGSGATDLEWVEASGRGTVYAVTVIQPKPPADAYDVALIDLDEGPRMMSRVEGIAARDVTIGMRVQARIAQAEQGPVLVFDPA